MSKDKPVCLIMTDSVALPRKYSKGIVQWKDTYPNSLKEELKDFEVISVSIGGASIMDLRYQVNYYKILRPEIVILHCGIVDAAPRAFGRTEINLIKKIRLFRFTKPWVSFLRRYRALHYTSPQLFETLLLEMKAELKAPEFYSLSILPASIEYEEKLPGIIRYIQIYNEILKKNSSLISLDGIPPEGITSDHHHLNPLGQEYVLHRILDTLGKTSRN